MLKKKNIVPIFCTVIYFACILLASRLLIVYSGSLFGWIGGKLELDAEVLSYGKEILAQLRRAAILSPWLISFVICALGCVLSVWASGTRLRYVMVVLGIILFVPFVLGAFLLTEVNSILIWKLLIHVLNLL